MRWLIFAILGFALLVSPASAKPDLRLALVIGNSAYPEAPLRNPANDARAVAAELRKQGFEVILRENAKRRDMEIAIADFGEKLSEGATGLFFYAGHGMQVQGRNYLVPIDARLSAEARVRFEAVDVDGVLDQMQAARARVSMVILDACRNNPYERRFRSSGGGLAQISAPEGTLIAYATAPGRVASDGTGTNGLYTSEFLRAVSTPGLKIEDVFKQVRANVSRSSGGAQVPWEASSLTGDFYFIPPPPPPAPVAAPAPPPGPSRQSLDLAFWEAVKNSNNPAELQAYIQRFPEGTFVPLAQARVAALSKPVPTPQLAATPPVATPLPPPAPSPQSLDLAFWESVKSSNNPSELQTYIQRFPEGTFVALARARVATLTRPAPEPAPAPVAQQQAALPPPANSNAVEMALWDSIKGTTNPVELQAYLDKYPKGIFAGVAQARIMDASRSAVPRSNAFDGIYTANFPGPKGHVQATLQITGTTITGHANPGEQTNPWSSNNFCRAAGTIDAAGVIGRLEMECAAYGWRFTGRVVPDKAGNYVIESQGFSNSATDVTVSWKKSRS